MLRIVARAPAAAAPCFTNTTGVKKFLTPDRGAGVGSCVPMMLSFSPERPRPRLALCGAVALGTFAAASLAGYLLFSAPTLLQAGQLDQPPSGSAPAPAPPQAAAPAPPPPPSVPL